MANPLFLGINKDSTDLKLTEAMLQLDDINLEIVDWEEWRDRQPLYKFGSLLSKLLLPALQSPIGGILNVTTDYVWDYLSDIPSVNKYLISAEYMLYMDKMCKDLPSVIYGHSLGAVVAVRLSHDIYDRTGVSVPVVLMSPPIGYKPFHKYFVFNRPPFSKDIKVTMTFGKYDWLTKVISKRHTKGLNPDYIRSIIGPIGHSFHEHAALVAGRIRSKEFRLGNLLNHIGNL